MTDVNLGSISYGVKVDDEEAVRGLSRLDSSVSKTESSLNTLTPASNKAQSAINKTGSTAQQAAPKMSKFAQVSQNAGYQIQDFTVQVAGGQSALLAFAQQAPQFLGAFGALGAGIGAGVALSLIHI